MKNLIKIVLPIIALTLASIACSKDDTDNDREFPQENPLTSFLQKSGFDELINNYELGASGEIGYKFKPKVKGTINAVTLKIPRDRTNIPVTIWDAETRAIIKTVTIPIVKANIEATQNIQPIEILPTKTYIISANNTRSYYERMKADQSDIRYPIEAGNISVLGANYMFSRDILGPTFPENGEELRYLYGDVSFVFQQTNY
ncbi:DUF4082 domain-containing protein [Epilithonimonas hispanica]|uniref:Uncharacterized protein n=1 Tax=Epilithonimonas hispanica TaxID=358687 RepID=A0A3D9CNJ1_9FLAO|nr:DUF4082 domain-containing protein [Epilithonimonas hispanica]REC67346.1 hypothetical protein DRF58_15355 [Epilithonimonas hispanica]